MAAEKGHGMWYLPIENPQKGRTWWWYWWIFFVDSGNNRPTKQFMVLWSTRYTPWIKVMNHEWRCRELPRIEEDGTIKFNGMVAAWYYNGKEMLDPYILKDCDFEVRKREGGGGEGWLKAVGCDGTYTYEGKPEKYRVFIQHDGDRMRYVLRPWHPMISDHFFEENVFKKRYAYNIYKIYGMKMSGAIHGEDVKGTGYLQRVTVNAPAAPWYWCMSHFKEGLFEFFMPFIGPQIFRTREGHRSLWNFGDIALKRRARFVYLPKEKELIWRSKHTKITHRYEDDLPVFSVRAEDGKRTLKAEISAYSRAYWRFEQKRKYCMANILYYNEYPAVFRELQVRDRSEGIDLCLDDLYHIGSNLEHTWGKLL